MRTAKLIKPSDEQLIQVAGSIRDEVLPNWDLKDIASGVQRVGVTEVGFVNEVYVSSGIFATLCYYHYSDRTRKPFRVNGFTVKQWRPASLKDHRGKQ